MKEVDFKHVKWNPKALDELFELIDSQPSKFKNQKEFEKWVEDGGVV